MAKKIHLIPSLLSKFTAINFQDNLQVDGRAKGGSKSRIMTGLDSLGASRTTNKKAYDRANQHQSAANHPSIQLTNQLTIIQLADRPIDRPTYERTNGG